MSLQMIKEHNLRNSRKKKITAEGSNTKRKKKIRKKVEEYKQNFLDDNLSNVINNEKGK